MRIGVLILTSIFLLSPGFSRSVSAAEKEKLQGVRQELNESLNALEKRIQDLESKSSRVTKQTRDEWSQMLSDLRRHRDEIRADLKKASDSTKENVNDFSQRIKNALAELKKGIESAQEKLKGSNPSHD